MLTNFDIPKIFKEYHTELHFIGMKNELPSTIQDGNYIINLDSAPNDGTHWLALRVHDKEAFFCDSFGAPPPIEIEKFVKKRKGARLAYSNVIVQDLKSSNCGYYASAFLIYCDRHMHKKSASLYRYARQYLLNYCDDSRLNDAVLRKMFKTFSSSGFCPPLITRLNNEKIRY